MIFSGTFQMVSTVINLRTIKVVIKCKNLSNFAAVTHSADKIKTNLKVCNSPFTHVGFLYFLSLIGLCFILQFRLCIVAERSCMNIRLEPSLCGSV